MPHRNSGVRLIRLFSLAATLLLHTTVQSPAQDIGTGPIPISREFASGTSLPQTGHLEVEGTLAGRSNKTIWIRIDDARSHDYSSRLNASRTISPGKFRFTLDFRKLRTTGNRPIEKQSIRRIVIFSDDAKASANITKATIVSPHSDSQATRPQRPPPTFARGQLPIEHDMGLLAFSPTDTLYLSGKANGKGIANLELRIDDETSRDYQTRANVTLSLTPGAFERYLPFGNFRKSNGQRLDIANITRLILSSPDPVPQVTIQSFEVKSSTRSATPGNAGNSRTIELGKGRLPVAYEPTIPLSVFDDDELVIEGVVNGKQPMAFLVRIDDGQSSSYATRYNEERQVPSGPFKIVTSMRGLRTPQHRIIDSGNIRRIIAAQYGSATDATITRMFIRKAASLPPGATGYALGRKDAPLPPGFERIAPDDHRIQGQELRAIRRPRPDPLVANGIEGVKRLVLPASPGPKRVTIWTEDPGEWHVLPSPHSRTIKVNGVQALAYTRTPKEWIKARYLRGSKTEHSSKDDAWTAYGRWRGFPVSIETAPGPHGIVIELEKHDEGSQFVSAVLIEPAGSSSAYTAVETWRAEWYQSNFRVDSTRPENSHIRPQFTLPDPPQVPPTALALRATSAPGQGVRLTITLKADREISRPRIKIDPPRYSGTQLPTMLWAGKRRLELDGTLLRLTDNMLIAEAESLPLAPSEPRTYEFWIQVPKTTPPGEYKGLFSLSTENTSYSIPMAIDVIPVMIPNSPKPAGFYLVDPPHLSQFRSLHQEQTRQVKCDLDFMAAIGISGTAPPAPHFTADNFTAFTTFMQYAHNHHVQPGWLVYNPLQSLGTSPEQRFNSAQTVARVSSALKRLNIPEPVWSAADEPSNPDQNPAHLKEFIETLRSKVPGIQLAGHLNSIADRPLIPMFDVAIVNHGFGLDHDNIRSVTSQKRRAWIYNTFEPRLTAGLWLWTTEAERYVQWHARLPTADPFDPLDGREADFQVLYPSAEVCPAQPDIHRHLLEMAEGLIDQRWLTWLERRTDPQAVRLTQRIRNMVGRSWQKATASRHSLPGRIRDEILAYARNSK